MAMDLKDRTAMEAAQHAKNIKREFKGKGRSVSRENPDGKRRVLKDGTVLPKRSER